MMLSAFHLIQMRMSSRKLIGKQLCESLHFVFKSTCQISFSFLYLCDYHSSAEKSLKGESEGIPLFADGGILTGTPERRKRRPRRSLKRRVLICHFWPIY